MYVIPYFSFCRYVLFLVNVTVTSLLSLRHTCTEVEVTTHWYHAHSLMLLGVVVIPASCSLLCCGCGLVHMWAWSGHKVYPAVKRTLRFDILCCTGPSIEQESRSLSE